MCEKKHYSWRKKWFSLPISPYDVVTSEGLNVSVRSDGFLSFDDIIDLKAQSIDLEGLQEELDKLDESGEKPRINFEYFKMFIDSDI